MTGIGRRRAVGLLAVLVAALLVTSCGTLGYYAQSIGGQSELMAARRPIVEVIADPATAPGLRDRLEAVLRIREFASRELALPDNGSYRSFADLHRRYVVWNVFATGPFEIAPRQWCFPVAGCVSYRGYFAEADARAFALRLEREGLDVFVSGVPAYSTLGWFDDPVLNTFIHYPPAELARLVFHELAHQVVYVRDDSVFNESFAVAVELEGVRRWLAAHGTAEERRRFERQRPMREAFTALALGYREKLGALYASDADEAAKRAGKRALFAELAREHAALKAEWGGFAGYEPWLGARANNASLASIGVYNQQVPAFQALLASVDGDLARFYQAVRELAARPKPERDRELARLVGPR